MGSLGDELLQGERGLGRVSVRITIKAKTALGYTHLVWYYGLPQTLKPNVRSSIQIRGHGMN